MIRPLPHHPWLTGRSDCSPSPSASVTSPCPTSIATTRHSKVRDRPHMAWPWGRWLHGRRTRPHTASGRRRHAFVVRRFVGRGLLVDPGPVPGRYGAPPGPRRAGLGAGGPAAHPVAADTRTAASRPPPAPGAPWRLRPHGAVRSGSAHRGRSRSASAPGGPGPSASGSPPRGPSARSFPRRRRSTGSGAARAVEKGGRCLLAPGPAGRARPVLTRAAYVDAVSPRVRAGGTASPWWPAATPSVRCGPPAVSGPAGKASAAPVGGRHAPVMRVHIDSSTLRGRSSAACCVLGHGQGPCRPACPRTAVPPPGPRAPVAAHMPEERCGIALDEDRSSVLTGCRVRVERFGGVQLAVLVPRGPARPGPRRWGGDARGVSGGGSALAVVPDRAGRFPLGRWLGVRPAVGSRPSGR